MKHYDYEISLFIDEELENDKQKEMFEHLAGCEDCMKSFSELIGLKNNVKDYYENILTDLNPVNIKTTIIKKRINYSVMAFSFIVLIIAAILFMLNYNERQILLNKYNSLNSKLLQIEKKQSEKPDKPEYAFKKDTVSLKASQGSKPAKINLPLQKARIKKEREKNPATFTRDSRYADYINSLKTDKITSDDFIIPQLIGN